MAVYKEEKTNTWRVLYRYTDWNGERKQSQKRGFKTKREAQAWEREQLNKLGGDLDMTFKSFVQHYTEDMQARIKENTWATKEHIIQTKLMPYFGKLKMCNITAQQIITWQNELINYKDDNGKPYSPVYLKTIHNQLSAIFNHAVRYYNLKENPCQKAGSMGKKKNREMLFWTKEEYLKFADAMMDKPMSYYAFEMLYWTGIFNDMTGSTGIMGVADTVMILRKEERFGDAAALCITGRDVEEKKLKMQMCGVRWEITEELNADDLRRERIPDFVYEVVEFLFEHSKFQGTATELLAAVGNTELKPNIASKYLTRYFSEVFLPMGISYEYRKTAAARLIILELHDGADGHDGASGNEGLASQKVLNDGNAPFPFLPSQPSSASRKEAGENEAS